MAPMFEMVNLAASRNRKFAKFEMFVENPNPIGKNERNEMLLAGKPIPGCNFNHLIRNHYIHNAHDNLSAIIPFTNALIEANLSPSTISYRKFKQLLSSAR